MGRAGIEPATLGLESDELACTWLRRPEGAATSRNRYCNELKEIARFGDAPVRAFVRALTVDRQLVVLHHGAYERRRLLSAIGRLIAWFPTWSIASTWSQPVTRLVLT
jgi:hypothetical protein